MRFTIGILLAFLSLYLPFSTGAQPELYMSPEIRNAYDSGIRNWDGSVPDSYRQNHTKYRIKAKVNPDTQQVSASAKITYYHNLPGELISFGFHAYKDLYENGMKITKLVVEGESLNITDYRRVRRSDTHYGVYIGKNPLKTGDSLAIEIEWSITIPENVDRDGAYDKTSMFVAYWYPEIAVYDNVFGWDKINFDGNTEFYHDFSDFEVEIEIPKNYVIWASGAPLNGDAIYPDFVQQRLSKVQNSDDPISIITKKDLKGLTMKSGIWKYSTKKTPDFSFAFSDHYLWDAAKYEDDFGTYFLNSAYPEKNKSFQDVIQIEKEAMEIFHNTFPKHPFPYNYFTSFNGENGGGMEFAGMCNNAAEEAYSDHNISLSSYEANKLLTVHEMAHMYFPFLMGINEKKYAWMDEGWAEFAEVNFSGVDLSYAKEIDFYGDLSQPPIMVESYKLGENAYLNSYLLAATSYDALSQLLGEEVFMECMNAYISRWQTKHPLPYDFFFTFNDVSGQNLNWFWKAWYFDWGYPDVAIKGFGNGELTLQNIGGKPVAASLEVIRSDGSKEKMEVNPNVWQHSSTHLINLAAYDTIVRLEVKTPNGVDFDPSNNVWKSGK